MLSKIEIVERQNNALHKLNEIAAISHINPKETLRQALQVELDVLKLKKIILILLLIDFQLINHLFKS